MNRILAAIAAFVFSAGAGAANPNPGGFGQGTQGAATAVPEISALEGTAALAFVAAFMLLVWERRRRAG